ncbi:hypothetical protein ABE525_07265 [Pseudomonas wadenswilerensis]|uniref:hypothetical protein n=1 Tax=Pseudomonas wadenswilerensis TaxID=1785161 RepID=UPI003208D3C3
MDSFPPLPKALNPQERQEYTDELLRLQLRRARAELDDLAPTGLKMKLKIVGDYLKPSAVAVSALAGIALGAMGFYYGTQEAADQKRDLTNEVKELSARSQDQQKQIADQNASLGEGQRQLILKKREFEQLDRSIKDALNDLKGLKSDITVLPEGVKKDALLKRLTQLDSSVGKAGTDSAAAVVPAQGVTPTASLAELIDGLFSNEAKDRVKAYRDLISQYGKSKELIPTLLNYANEHFSNDNGVYNALVVFSHLDYRNLRGADLEAIRAFASRATAEKGERTKDRASKLMDRLKPH